MQPSVLVPLADGFEEIEAITVIDVLRRADINVVVAGVKKKNVQGAHGVKVIAQVQLEEVDKNSLVMVVLPGGMPGAENLLKNETLRLIIQDLDKKDKPIGAICAAPWVLSSFGVLKEHFTCYPSFEKRIEKGEYHKDKNVVSDKNVFTASGPGTAMEFALAVVEALRGKEIYEKVKKELLFK
jgi:4-methyl-5(b-hydroxyethyl)-thiazole monophosphate biosynthesis